uniref:Centrosomal protein 152 n=1 Tax=Paramormyrops kingsleyae TaxID=1676925 RepID=A0A3B3QZS0_9TELE|nr:centrosomal protein of 152 kDa isoform X2 [Paramormyrops kingsleyae]
MSIDFDSAALQTQHEEEEYDQEDYAREQELQQLLTDLPDDMLEDSRDGSSPEPDNTACDGHALDGRAPATWDPRAEWNDEHAAAGETDEIEYGQDPYHGHYEYDQEAERFDGHLDQHNGWTESREEDRHYMYDHRGYAYPSMGPEESTGEGEFGQYHHTAPQREDLNYSDQASSRDHVQTFDAKGSENNRVGHLKVNYNPYQPVAQQKVFSPEAACTNGKFDQLQREFLDSTHKSADQQQIAQLQVLNRAQLRQIEDLEKKLEDSRRSLRYLEHQLAIVKDEKDGLAVSLKESGCLLEEAKERELQLQARVKALEQQVQTVADRERESTEQQRAAEVALDSLQQQMAELCRSETLARTRKQHDRDLAAMREQHEARMLTLQQRLDAQTQALEQQGEAGCRLQEQLKQLERDREAEKLERAAIINTLSQRLEESQQQCANLLQTGAIQEMNQLRIQLQQAQSAKSISDSMTRSLQEELSDLKDQITLYESAVRLQVISLESNREWEDQLSDSYVELGIKKANWKSNRCHGGSGVTSAMTSTSSRVDLTAELTTEIQRLLGSLKSKRQKISQLQEDLQQARGQAEELRVQLDRAERSALDSRVRETALEKQLEASGMAPSQEELQQLRKDREHLQDRAEKLEKLNQELKQSEEKVRAANLELCTKMREMIQELDQEKQETAARYEKTQQQFRDDVVNRVRAELTQEHAVQMEEVRRECQQEVQNLESKLADVSKEMGAVQECYIAICREKDGLEQSLRARMEEHREHENELRRQMEREKEAALAQMEAQHATARERWLREREEELQLQVEAEVALRQSEVMQAAVKKVETEWAQRLEQAGGVGGAEASERASQTEGVVQGLPHVEVETQLSTQRLELQQEAEQARAQAVREAEQRVRAELHSEQLEATRQQVEGALSQARACWLQEMTSLPEYQAALQTQREDWERQQQENLAQKVSSAMREELQEEVRLLRRQLEQSRVEQDAHSKAELAACSRDKQEEVARLQARHEQEFRALLDEQRGRLEEALSLASTEAGHLRDEALRQKEADLRQLFKRREQEWEALQEARSSTERERLWEEALAEVHATLEGIRNQLLSDPEWLTQNEVQTPSSPQDSSAGGVGRLSAACLQAPCRALLCQAVAQARQQWEEINRDRLKEAQNQHEKELNGVRASASQAGEQQCGPGCADRLQRLQRQCRDLQRHLEKACRQLQQTVREHKAAVQRLKEEHEDALKKEREEILRRASDRQRPGSTDSSQPQGDGGPERQQCLQGGLEEMREQYMRAVAKIRGDMLRYIQESKARAVEMIRAEVLRERQDTARRMRKYYLTCLQELLEDSGKAQGAEKKIINAASKLAAMAKVLETPVSRKPSGRSHAALASTSKLEPIAGEEPGKAAHALSGQSPPAKDVNSQSSGPEEINQQARSLASSAGRPAAEHSGIEKNVRDLQSSSAPGVLVTSGKRKVFDGTHSKGPPNPASSLAQRPAGHVKCLPSASRPVDGTQTHVTLRRQNQEMWLAGADTRHPAESAVKPIPDKEPPVRNKGQNVWGLVGVGTRSDHQNPAFSIPSRMLKRVSNSPTPSAVSSTETEHTDDDSSHFGSWASYKNIPTTQTRPNMKPSPIAGPGGRDTEAAKTREPIPGSEGERIRRVCSKSLFSELKACQQDSGFDSPVSLLQK